MKKIVIFSGITITGFILFWYLKHPSKSRLRFIKGNLDRDSLIQILQRLQITFPSQMVFLMNEFQCERRRFFKKDQTRYIQTIAKYLQRQKTLLQKSIQQILEQYKISTQQFENALSEWKNDLLIIEALECIRPDFSYSNYHKVPNQLTKQLYQQIIQQYSEKVEKIKSLSDIERTEIQLGFYDDIWERYSFQAQDLAAAKRIYKSEAIETITERLKSFNL